MRERARLFSGSYQRRPSGSGVQEGREVLVCVCVLVLVVVLMELEGKRRNAGLVLRRPTRRARCGAGGRGAAGGAATCGRRAVFTPRDTASTLTFWRTGRGEKNDVLVSSSE